MDKILSPTAPRGHAIQRSPGEGSRKGTTSENGQVMMPPSRQANMTYGNTPNRVNLQKLSQHHNSTYKYNSDVDTGSARPAGKSRPGSRSSIQSVQYVLRNNSRTKSNFSDKPHARKVSSINYEERHSGIPTCNYQNEQDIKGTNYKKQRGGNDRSKRSADQKSEGIRLNSGRDRIFIDKKDTGDSFDPFSNLIDENSYNYPKPLVPSISEGASDYSIQIEKKRILVKNSETQTDETSTQCGKENSLINIEDFRNLTDLQFTNLTKSYEYNFPEGSEDVDPTDVGEEYRGGDIYVCYLMTDQGAVLGPMRLDIHDIKLGLPPHDHEEAKSVFPAGSDVDAHIIKEIRKDIDNKNDLSKSEEDILGSFTTSDDDKDGIILTL